MKLEHYRYDFKQRAFHRGPRHIAVDFGYHQFLLVW